VCIIFYSESQNYLTSATKRPAIVLKDDNDDDDRVTCLSTLSDQEQPEVVRRRAAQPPVIEKNVDDEMVSRAKSPIGTGFHLMMSSSGAAAPLPLSVHRSAARVLAPAPSATAFQLAAFHNIYASQQQQQQQQHQLRQTHQLSPHLRFSLFTDLSPAPGTYSLASIGYIHFYSPFIVAIMAIIIITTNKKA